MNSFKVYYVKASSGVNSTEVREISSNESPMTDGKLKIHQVKYMQYFVSFKIIFCSRNPNAGQWRDDSQILNVIFRGHSITINDIAISGISGGTKMMASKDKNIWKCFGVDAISCS